MSGSACGCRFFEVARFELVPRRLDFSSSNGKEVTVLSLETGGVSLVNAVELVEADADGTQVLVCEQCGITGCRRGGWVAMRRLGETVVWIPVWAEMEQDPDSEEEYAPPALLAEVGLPRFGVSVWEKLCDVIDELPPMGEVPVLTAAETARLLQWAAPGEVLGAFPDPPALRTDLLLAVSEGELEHEAAAVAGLLGGLAGSRDAVTPAPPGLEPVPVTFHLDLPDLPAWSPAASVRGGLAALVGDAALVRVDTGRGECPE
ncbi:MAG TPA: hypothetical protein ENK19_05515 [Acidobacteria bacterium]|nr:hypothetical protein [Acidobacteriota bacterium]